MRRIIVDTIKKRIIFLFFFLFCSHSLYGQGDARSVVKEEKKTLRDSQKSQKKIDKLADETQTLLQKYRQTLRRIENVKIYNQQLRETIKSQVEEKKNIAEQIETLKNTNEGIVPLMVKMVENIAQFVSLDIPFLPDERGKRIDDLNKLLTRADISTSEKFRRILEAYQVENDYGRTIEAYRGIHKKGQQELTVDYLRIGRIALLYQTLDGKESALWNPQTRSWDELSSSYRKSITEGLKMARKQTAPQLLKLPITAATGK